MHREPARRKTALRLAVACTTAAAMLVAQGVIVANGTWQTMLEPQLISKAFDGSFAEDDSWEPDISDNGRYIVFTSDSNDLTVDDEDVNGSEGERDVFRYDRATSTMELVSKPSDPEMTATRGSRDAQVSDDGRYVLFLTGNSFAPEDTNDTQDYYVKDMETGEFHFVDFYGDGSGLGNAGYDARIAGDASYMVFVSGNGDLLNSGKTEVSRNVWGYDLESDEATLVSTPPGDGIVAYRGSRDADISDDGRYVVVLTGNGWDEADNNDEQDYYIRDMLTGVMRYVDWDGEGTAVYDNTWDTVISGDGNRIAFVSDDQLLPEDTGAPRDVYSYDLVSDEATLVSGPYVERRGSRSPQLSDDGNTIFFYTGQPFAEDDADTNQDFYLKDFTTGEFTRIPATSEDGLWGDEIDTISMSGDGLHLTMEAYDGGEMLRATPEGVVPAKDASNVDNIYYVPVVRPALSDGSTRIAGTTRYSTAVDVSMASFPEGAETVVIATGEDWPDALGGAALCGAVDGPMLLTNSDSLPPEVSAELIRLGARNVYILGGYNAISPTVETQLEMLLPGYVWRLGGPDRYATSKAVANRVVEIQGTDYDGKACVTTGMNFPDAVGAAPLGAGLGWPVLLVRPTDPSVLLPPTTESVVILGGTAAVGPAVEASLIDDLGDAEVDRIGGPTRYETSAMAAQYGVDYGLLWNSVGITSGENYPDALTGGVALGLYRSTLLLTPTDSLHPAAAAALDANAEEIQDVTFLGGGAAVSPAVENQVKAILGL